MTTDEVANPYAFVNYVLDCDVLVPYLYSELLFSLFLYLCRDMSVWKQLLDTQFFVEAARWTQYCDPTYGLLKDPGDFICSPKNRRKMC